MNVLPKERKSLTSPRKSDTIENLQSVKEQLVAAHAKELKHFVEKYAASRTRAAKNYYLKKIKKVNNLYHPIYEDSVHGSNEKRSD